MSSKMILITCNFVGIIQREREQRLSVYTLASHDTSVLDIIWSSLGNEKFCVVFHMRENISYEGKCLDSKGQVKMPRPPCQVV